VEGACAEERNALHAASCVAVGVLSSLLFSATPSLAQDAPLPDRSPDDATLLSDFSVTFLGYKVDHKELVELVVFGQTVGFVGSVIGGLQARERKKEVEALNRKLISVNKQLRSRERSAPPQVADPSPSLFANEVVAQLRQGKSLLRAKDAKAAQAIFQSALDSVLARSAAESNGAFGNAADGLDEPWKAQRKALRGLGACAQQLGDLDGALRYMTEVLALSEQKGDASAVADAIGVIADLYTDKGVWAENSCYHRCSHSRACAGDLDLAGRYYDRYLKAMAENT